MCFSYLTLSLRKQLAQCITKYKRTGYAQISKLSEITVWVVMPQTSHQLLKRLEKSRLSANIDSIIIPLEL